MRDWIAVSSESLTGFDVVVISHDGEVRRFESFEPNRVTDLLDLQQGRWTVHNDSPFILRLQAHFVSGYSHINTLRPSEYCSFDWPNGNCKLMATLCTSAQVFHRPSIDTDIYMQRAQALKLSKWDYFFYQYMVAANTACSRILEGPSKSPDFTVVLSDKTVPVELKGFYPNKPEKREAELLRTRECGDALNIEIGQRVAESAKKARRQLRSFFDQNIEGPAILAIMDPHALGHAYPEHLAALFEGKLAVELSGGGVDIYRREGRRSLQHEHNRILSAIAVLVLSGKAGLAVRSESGHADQYITANLAVYHNPYAKHPLSTDVLATFGFPQHIIGPAEPPAVHVRSLPLKRSL